MKPSRSVPGKRGELRVRELRAEGVGGSAEPGLGTGIVGQSEGDRLRPGDGVRARRDRLEVGALAATGVQLAPGAAAGQAVEVAAAALAAKIAVSAELGVGQEDLVALVVVEHAEDVELVGAEVAPAAGQGGAVFVLAAGLAAADGRLEAAIVAPHDDVHHAGDGVGAVDRRGAVLQDLDPLDRARGNGVQVDEGVLQVLGEAVAGDPAAVDQHQGRLLAEAAQRDAGGARGEAVGEAFAEAAAGVRRQVAQHFRDRRLARSARFLPGDHVDRRDGLGVDALDVRSRDLDPLHLLRLLLLCNGRNSDSAGAQGHHGQADLSLSKHHSLIRSLKLAAGADESLVVQIVHRRAPEHGRTVGAPEFTK